MNTLNLSLMSNDNVQNLIGLDMNFVEISERINDLLMSMRTKEFDIESAINMIYYIIIESKLENAGMSKFVETTIDAVKDRELPKWPQVFLTGKDVSK